MSTRTIRRLIIAAILLEFLWFIILPAGNRLAPERSPELVQAIRAFETNRSETNRAAMWEEAHRDDLRDARRKAVLFSLMMVTDVAVISLFWNYGIQRQTA